jgi:hypothetical protein
MKNIICGIILIVLFGSCDKTNETFYKESCDFLICEEGRNSTDTLVNAYGVLLNNDAQYYIEVTGNAPKPNKIYISCLANEITLPETGKYVRFSGYIKDPCSEETSVSVDSLFLNEIEEINTLIQETCEQEILHEGFDIDKNDEKLTIHHLSIDDDCLQVLISYTGNCSQSIDFFYFI